MRRLLIALVAALTLGTAGTAGAAQFPDRLALPDGSQPEGITSGTGQELLVGSIPTGDIYRFDARTGARTLAIDAPEGSAAIGIEAVKEQLFVAGGPTGKGFVYDLRTDRQTVLPFVTDGQPTFVNDVTITPKKAYFTDSQRAVLYVVDRKTLAFKTLPVDVPLVPGFNLNGIEDARGGKVLLAVNSTSGILYRIDPRTGDARAVDLNGSSLQSGDGLLLVGKRLYVVQNRMNQVAVIRLAGDFASGRLEKTITSSRFDVPTTVARLGNRLYLPNARFGNPSPATAEYWVTKVRR